MFLNKILYPIHNVAAQLFFCRDYIATAIKLIRKAMLVLHKSCCLLFILFLLLFLLNHYSGLLYETKESSLPESSIHFLSGWRGVNTESISKSFCSRSKNMYMQHNLQSNLLSSALDPKIHKAYPCSTACKECHRFATRSRPINSKAYKRFFPGFNYVPKVSQHFILASKNTSKQTRRRKCRPLFETSPEEFYFPSVYYPSNHHSLF